MNNVKNSNTGIQINSSDNNVFNKNNITDIKQNSLILYDSDNSTFKDTFFAEAKKGIVVRKSSDNYFDVIDKNLFTSTKPDLRSVEYDYVSGLSSVNNTAKIKESKWTRCIGISCSSDTDTTFLTLNGSGVQVNAFLGNQNLSNIPKGKNIVYPYIKVVGMYHNRSATGPVPETDINISYGGREVSSDFNVKEGTLEIYEYRKSLFKTEWNKSYKSKVYTRHDYVKGKIQFSYMFKTRIVVLLGDKKS